MAYRQFQDPQTVDSSRADAEWKSDAGAGNLIDGQDGASSSVDRSSKAAALPESDPDTQRKTAHGTGLEVIGGEAALGKDSGKGVNP